MGKDRVGVGTALLLCALGIPRETIMEDYLRTNRYLEDDLQHMIRLLETKMIVDNEIMDKIKALYRVKKNIWKPFLRRSSRIMEVRKCS